ncbi:SEC11A [Cordylochernes scorpioides]|uniref:Signal peptidase complex catalytic subunit SEC11 n=1 Tax=Cordylochernes scorpioides TaxID=51811 RepID=A0ABY6KC72_9ARAC|nr:SEC11A [Cordylochernes scorpioides]
MDEVPGGHLGQAPARLFFLSTWHSCVTSSALMVALMIWKGLMVVTGSESPIVVVLSGSMEPAFHRGDLLFLTNHKADPIRVGDIVVFKVDGREIPIVHRVLKLHENCVKVDVCGCSENGTARSSPRETTTL